MEKKIKATFKEIMNDTYEGTTSDNRPPQDFLKVLVRMFVFGWMAALKDVGATNMLERVRLLGINIFSPEWEPDPTWYWWI